MRTYIVLCRGEEIYMSNTLLDTKKLGFGLMRLPKNGEVIDVEQVKVMVDHFMEAGFTYFDTAWAYGGSEEAIAEALVKRYPRESYTLATKVAPWINSKSAEEAKEQLQISLDRTGAGYFDFYLLHNLGAHRSKFFDDFGMWDWILEKKKEGVIKYAGFSCHGTAEELDELLTAHPQMDFVQLQINYADWNNPAIQSKACYEVARKHNTPIVIMEPVKGGLLANPPQAVEEFLKAENPDLSAASWAIRYAAGLEGVITVLSGMSNVEQMDDNIAYMKEFKKLSGKEQEVLANAQKVLESYNTVPCTNCKYCEKVCPQNIGIPASFAAINHLNIYQNLEAAKGRERWLVVMHGYKRATECVECGECEQVCPQHISIREELKKVAKALEM